MKKLLIALILSFFLTEGASAAKVRFALKADVLFSKITTDYKSPLLEYLDVPLKPYSCDNYVGVSVLGEFKIDILKGLGVDTGLGFSTLGGNTNWGGMFVDGVQVFDLTMSMYYLYIPACVRYRFDLPVFNSLISPSVFTGPTVMFKVAEKRMLPGDVSDVVVTWKAGIALLFKKHFEVSASYNFSLNNACDFEARLSINKLGKVSNKFSYWSLGIGYVW